MTKTFVFSEEFNESIRTLFGARKVIAKDTAKSLIDILEKNKEEGGRLGNKNIWLKFDNAAECWVALRFVKMRQIFDQTKSTSFINKWEVYLYGTIEIDYQKRDKLFEFLRLKYFFHNQSLNRIFLHEYESLMSKKSVQRQRRRRCKFCKELNIITIKEPFCSECFNFSRVLAMYFEKASSFEYAIDAFDRDKNPWADVEKEFKTDAEYLRFYEKLMKWTDGHPDLPHVKRTQSSFTVGEVELVPCNPTYHWTIE